MFCIQPCNQKTFSSVEPSGSKHAKFTAYKNWNYREYRLGSLLLYPGLSYVVWRNWIFFSYRHVRLCSPPFTHLFSSFDRIRIVETSQENITLQSEITCPECGHTELETMPTNACQWFYDCIGCGAVLKPKSGDCCVYCSYGTVPCPPIQVSNSCCS